MASVTYPNASAPAYESTTDYQHDSRQQAQISSFIDKTTQLLSQRKEFSFFSFSNLGGFQLPQWPASPLYVNRSTCVNIGNTTHISDRSDSEERKRGEERKQMLLATVAGAIFAFVLGRQLQFITDEGKERGECVTLQNTLGAFISRDLSEVVEARKAVHDRNIDDARFYRDVAISSIASSALVFVGAAYSFPPVAIAGATLGFGTVVYGMVKWGASSISRDTLASRYNRLQDALDKFGPSSGTIPLAQAYPIN